MALGELPGPRGPALALGCRAQRDASRTHRKRSRPRRAAWLRWQFAQQRHGLVHALYGVDAQALEGRVFFLGRVGLGHHGH